MALTNRVQWETLRSRLSTSLDGTYQTLGTSLVFPSYILKMVNDGTTLVTVSIDGVNDIDVCPPGCFWLYDEGKVGISADAPAVRAGTQIYIKGVAGTTGSIYLVSQYIAVG